jgi:hypothetical protein
LVRQGAVALDPARMPDAEEFRRMLAAYRPPARPDQGRLFEPGGRKKKP